MKVLVLGEDQALVNSIVSDLRGKKMDVLGTTTEDEAEAMLEYSGETDVWKTDSWVDVILCSRAKESEVPARAWRSYPENILYFDENEEVDSIVDRLLDFQVGGPICLG